MTRTLMVFSAVAFAAVLWTGTASAATCLMCGKDSSGDCDGAQQCKHPDEDGSEARKACTKAGCKITGTSSCSTAANVKVCEVSYMTPVTPDFPVPERATASSGAVVDAVTDAVVGWMMRLAR